MTVFYGGTSHQNLMWLLKLYKFEKLKNLNMNILHGRKILYLFFLLTIEFKFKTEGVASFPKYTRQMKVFTRKCIVEIKIKFMIQCSLEKTHFFLATSIT